MEKKPRRPHFLVQNPNAAASMTAYLQSNLDEFKVEELLEFIFNNVFKPIAKYDILLEEGEVVEGSAVYNDDGDLSKTVNDVFAVFGDSFNEEDIQSRGMPSGVPFYCNGIQMDGVPWVHIVSEEENLL